MHKLFSQSLFQKNFETFQGLARFYECADKKIKSRLLKSHATS